MIQLAFAFLAGVLTIAAPCILPMLPILLGASIGQKSRQRPLLIVAGFIVSFAAASLILSTIITHLGLSQNTLRYAAVVLLALFAALMIWPKPFELLMVKLSGTINKANQVGQGSGNMSGLILGLVLGILWTPCAGPILGTILTLIATQGTTTKSLSLLAAYAIGAGVPMLIIAYGSQYITTKVRAIAQYAVRIQQVFGVLVLLLAVAMFFQVDVKIVKSLTAFFPQSSLEEKLASAGPTGPGSTLNQMKQLELGNYGQAPQFSGINHWLNSNPLTLEQLKGKVVLVDFWTYSCINCLRTLPYVTAWYDKYKDDGLVVIGVHTPEFAFEKETSNVQTAIQQLGIHYPVAQDNDYDTWSAYSNQYWPAEYLIDKNGVIVHEHFGEGQYDVTENLIRQLLGMKADSSAKTSTLGNINSPEMYFEPSRLQYLAPEQSASPGAATYTLPSKLTLNTFAIGGTWQFTDDHAELTKPNGSIRLHFSSGKVFMVAASEKPVTLHITVDGAPQPDVTVQLSKLYTLFDSTNYSEHTIDITIPDAGLQAFTFTFG